MTSAVPTPDRPTRFGLAAKLFAILILLGAVAVLVTGVLGYMRARDALEESIYNQLTATRKSKARQVETYFRTIRNELSQLAVSKMAVDAARGFNAGFDALDRADVPFDLRRQVGDWYETQFMPDIRRILGHEPNVNDYLPVGPAAYYLQYHYIVANPYPADRRKLLDDAGDGSAYSAQHAIYHPLLRSAATSFGFFDLMLADPRTGRIVYGVAKEVDLGASLRTGSYRQSNLAAAVARCGAVADRSTVCLEDFAAYAPSGGAPIAFMAAPVIDQGRAYRRAGGAVVDRGDRQCRDRRSPLAPGRIRRHRRGLPDRLRSVRALRPAGLLRTPRAIFRRAEAAAASRTRTPKPSAATARRCCISASRPMPRRPLLPASRASARSSAIAASRRSPPGGRLRFPASSGR